MKYKYNAILSIKFECLTPMLLLYSVDNSYWQHRNFVWFKTHMYTMSCAQKLEVGEMILLLFPTFKQRWGGGGQKSGKGNI